VSGAPASKTNAFLSRDTCVLSALLIGLFGKNEPFSTLKISFCCKFFFSNTPFPQGKNR
jgi:hypothetical protein